MKILVTGSTGFFGTTLGTQLVNQGHELTKINSRNTDLTQAGSLNQFPSQSFDQIYHLAAWTQAGDFCLSHPGEQ